MFDISSSLLHSDFKHEQNFKASFELKFSNFFEISCVRSVSRRGPGMSCGFDSGTAIGMLSKRSASIQKESFEPESISEPPVFWLSSKKKFYARLKKYDLISWSIRTWL